MSDVTLVDNTLEYNPDVLKPNNPCGEFEEEFNNDDLVYLLDRNVKG